MSERAWNACDNEWCEGTMQTTRVTCGADPGREERCTDCGRTVEHGWGPPRVRWEGRKHQPSTPKEPTA